MDRTPCWDVWRAVSDSFHTNRYNFSRNSSRYKILVLCVSLLKIGLLANFLALFPSKAFLELYPILFLLKNGQVLQRPY